MRKELYFKNIGLFLGQSITEDQLEKVAELSGVLADNDDYLPADLRAKCEQAMPDPLELDVGDFANAFRFLKENVDSDTQDCLALIQINFDEINICRYLLSST